MKPKHYMWESDKELLEKLFEFETYCTARFDSEARVAFAVYDYVKKMKRHARQDSTRHTNNT
jgi:hypothetical protein